MIKGNCVFSLDGFDKDDCPVKFVAVPSKGELVRSQSGTVLVVKNVTHSWVTVMD
jgi:hypothetical protein